MLQNYLLTALRHLFRNQLYSLINVIGLAIGISSCILIALLIRYEFSYHTFTRKRRPHLPCNSRGAGS